MKTSFTNRPSVIRTVHTGITLGRAKRMIRQWRKRMVKKGCRVHSLKHNLDCAISGYLDFDTSGGCIWYVPSSKSVRLHTYLD